MCEATTIAIWAAVASTAVSAYGQHQQGKTAEKVARNNQIMSEYAAQDTLRRGEDEALAARRRAAQLGGSQRALMAARGLDLGEGTPAELIDQTDFFGEQDATTARDNAKRDAWTARVSGANAALEGRLARQQGEIGAFGTVLGGGAQVADSWYRYNPPKQKKGT